MESRLKRNVFLKATEAVVTIAASFTQLAVITHMYTPVTVGDYQVSVLPPAGIPPVALYEKSLP